MNMGMLQEARLGVHRFMLCGRCPGLETALLEQQLEAAGLVGASAASGPQHQELAVAADTQTVYGLVCWLYSGG